MQRRLGSYTTYSIGCFVAWGLIFAFGLATGHSRAGHPAVLIFAGWVIGWLSASIARILYPPPRRRGGPFAQ